MQNHRAVAYFLLRFAIGMNIFCHGFFRILSGVSTFATGMAKHMAPSPLPQFAMLPFTYSIPFIEVTLGALLLVGLGTRWALAALSLFMIMLTLGVTSQQDWAGAGAQLGYTFVFFFALFYVEYNDYSVDTLLRRKA